jgi:cellulose synthase (UDP-forming)
MSPGPLHDLLGPYIPAALVAGFFVLITPLLPWHRTWARVLVALVGITPGARYLAWRWFATLGPNALESAEGAWHLFVLFFEILAFINSFILFIILTRWTDRATEADRHEARIRALPASQLPSVDVLIPTYNEGLDVLERTILAALELDYPNFRVYVLDDGARDWLKHYCAQVGAGYIRRAERTHAKAGNLNHALTVTSGELVAVFDADFAPIRDFLYRTVGFFDDPKIGIVQSPQYFFNPDPIQLNLGLAGVLPHDQRLFFDAICPARDAWNVAFCCGSCSLQRRAALEAVGGVPTGSVTEDILSTMVLLRKGYVTRYLPERLSMGLAAESLKGYFTQRERWCRGGIQTLFLRDGPLGPGLTLLQRLFFLPLDWLSQYPCRLLMILVPIVYLWTGVGPFLVHSADDLISYQFPAFLAIVAALRFFAPYCYVPILSAATSLFMSLRLAPTAFASLIKPFGTPFRVTPKGRGNAPGSGDPAVLGTLGLLAGLTVGGLIVNRTSPDLSAAHDDILVAEVYALINLVVLALATLMAIEVPRSRSTERFPVQCPATYVGNGREWPCKLLDISESGARLAAEGRLEVGDALELAIPGLGPLPAHVVRATPVGAAVEFDTLTDTQRRALILFIYSAGLSNEVHGLDLGRVFRKLVARWLE